MIKEIFYVPKYYKEFKCKGNDCLNTCCKNWNITLTMKDYDKVSSLDCSPELKEKIDKGISIFNNATKDRYAKIDLNYYGECKLRLANGYCGLQCEMGEDNIPSVCRYYPRAPRIYPAKQCVISLSCEWVVEYIFSSVQKLEFEERELTFYIESDDIKLKDANNYANLRDESINIITSRNLSLLDRFNSLADRFNTTLNFDSEYNKKMIKELSNFYSHSFSIGDYINLDNIKSYELVLNTLNEKIPNYEIYLEKILVNHMLYVLFPFVSYKEDPSYSVKGLFYVFLFLNQLVYNMLEKENAITVISNYFRVAEHANMYDVIFNLQKRID